MQKLLWVSLLSLSIVGCVDKESKNPYQESHIGDVAPKYVIELNDTPRLTKAMIDQMEVSELKTRFSELQNQDLTLTPAQKKEFNMISDRLRQLSSSE